MLSIDRETLQRGFVLACCMSKKYHWCTPYETSEVDGKDYCVFHAPITELNTEQFNKLIFTEIDRADKVDGCDLSGTIFKREICFSRYNEKNSLPQIIFRHAEFNEFTDFSEVNFSKKVSFSFSKFKNTVYFDLAEFSEESIFSYVQFEGHAFFNKNAFKGNAKFNEAKFNNYSEFANVTFSKDANFYNAQFSKDATFFKAKFSTAIRTSSPEANFNDAKFFGEVNFKASIFSGYSLFIATTFNNETNFSVAEFDKAIFAHAKFNGETYFLDSVFGQETDFSKARFNEDADFNGASFDGDVDFSFARFHKLIRFSKRKSNYVFKGAVSFVDVIIKEKLRLTDVNLSKVSFLYSDLKKMDFISCEWGKNKRRYILYDEINIFKNKNDSKFNDEIKKVEALYRRLKQKYKEEHNEPEVSNWHYCEKEMQRATEKRKFLNLFYIYYLSSGYGEKPLRAFILLFSLIVILTFILNFVGVQTNPVYCNNSSCIEIIQGFSIKLDWQRLKSLIGTAFQHSLFVRTPDYIPSSEGGRFIVLLLSKLLIPLQATLFAFSLRNRFRR